MTYNKEEMFKFLLESNIIVAIGDKFCVNQIIAKKVKKVSITQYCKNYPKNFIGISNAIIYTKIMDECEIPIMMKGSLSYFVRTQSVAATRVLINILSDPSIDYNKFIYKTKSFYNSDISFPGFAKYLIEGTWKAVYVDTKNKDESKIEQKGLI